MHELTLDHLIAADTSPIAQLLPLELADDFSSAPLTVGSIFRFVDDPIDERERRRLLIAKRLVTTIDFHRANLLQAVSKEQTVHNQQELESLIVKGLLADEFNGFLVNNNLEERLNEILETPPIKGRDMKISVFSLDTMFQNESEIQYVWSKKKIAVLALSPSSTLGKVAIKGDSLKLNRDGNELTVELSFLPYITRQSSIRIINLEE